MPFTITASADWQPTIYRRTGLTFGPLVAEVEPSWNGREYDDNRWEWVVTVDAYSGGFSRSGEAPTQEAAQEAAEAAIREAFDGQALDAPAVLDAAAEVLSGFQGSEIANAASLLPDLADQLRLGVLTPVEEVTA